MVFSLANLLFLLSVILTNLWSLPMSAFVITSQFVTILLWLLKANSIRLLLLFVCFFVVVVFCFFVCLVFFFFGLFLHRVITKSSTFFFFFFFFFAVAAHPQRLHAAAGAEVIKAPKVA